MEPSPFCFSALNFGQIYLALACFHSSNASENSNQKQSQVSFATSFKSKCSVTVSAGKQQVRHIKFNHSSARLVVEGSWATNHLPGGGLGDVVIRFEFRHSLCNRPALVWIDNKSVRLFLVKGTLEFHTFRSIAKLFHLRDITPSHGVLENSLQRLRKMCKACR